MGTLILKCVAIFVVVAIILVIATAHIDPDKGWP